MNKLRKFLVTCGLASLAFSLPAPSSAQDGGPKGTTEAGRIQVHSVEVHLSPVGHMVLLRVRNKAVPVLVDAIVAESIQGALTGKKTARPLTHELMSDVLRGFDGKVSQVVVTLKERIFYGALTVVVGKTAKVFDSRSSDAIALAIHFNAPILVSQELLDSVGVELEEPGGKRL